MNFHNRVFKRCICRIVVFCYLFVTQQLMPYAIVAGIAGFTAAPESEKRKPK